MRIFAATHRGILMQNSAIKFLIFLCATSTVLLAQDIPISLKNFFRITDARSQTSKLESALVFQYLDVDYDGYISQADLWRIESNPIAFMDKISRDHKQLMTIVMTNYIKLKSKKDTSLVQRFESLLETLETIRTESANDIIWLSSPKNIRIEMISEESSMKFAGTDNIRVLTPHAMLTIEIPFSSLTLNLQRQLLEKNLDGSLSSDAKIEFSNSNSDPRLESLYLSSDSLVFKLKYGSVTNANSIATWNVLSGQHLYFELHHERFELRLITDQIQVFNHPFEIAQAQKTIETNQRSIEAYLERKAEYLSQINKIDVELKTLKPTSSTTLSRENSWRYDLLLDQKAEFLDFIEFIPTGIKHLQETIREMEEHIDHLRSNRRPSIQIPFESPTINEKLKKGKPSYAASMVTGKVYISGNPEDYENEMDNLRTSIQSMKRYLEENKSRLTPEQHTQINYWIQIHENKQKELVHWKTFFTDVQKKYNPEIIKKVFKNPEAHVIKP